MAEVQAGTGAQAEAHTRIKTHAACDECRTKKLKCTGERPSCARCVREGITCVYSPQKQMGRPKKRLRADDADMELSESTSADTMAATTVWNVANMDGVDPWMQTSNDVNGLGNGVGFDMAAFDSALISAGPAPPWPLPDGYSAGELNLPMDGLTPDHSSAKSSPMTVNRDQDQRSINGQVLSVSETHSHTSPQAPPQAGSHCLGTTLLPPCACLSTMYLTLNDLQAMDPAFTFPFALQPLREAMKVTEEVIKCEECPKRFLSAIQNTQLIGTLLVAVAERFSKVLEALNREAQRAESASETKKFRLTDHNSGTPHLHTGGLGCHAAFNLDLSPAEWRIMTKKVVKAEVYGASDGNDCCPSLYGLTRQMHARQMRWHTMPLVEDFPRGLDGKAIGGPHHVKEGDHVCLKMAKYAEMLMEGFDWT